MMNRQNDVNVNLVERWMSMALGGLLTTRGIRGGGLRGLLITLLGGYLTQRGLTGHCLVYEALGMNTASPTTEPAAMLAQESPRQPARKKTTRSSTSGGGQFSQPADQAEGERDEGAKSRKVGRNPDQAEGSEANVDASLRQGG